MATSRMTTSTMMMAQKTAILETIKLISIPCQIFKPEKHMNAMAISPTVMKVMPSP